MNAWFCSLSDTVHSLYKKEGDLRSRRSKQAGRSVLWTTAGCVVVMGHARPACPSWSLRNSGQMAAISGHL